MTRRLVLGGRDAWGPIVADVTASLRRNEVAVLPAEGLYGYHAIADNADALAALQRVKPREPGRGWIVLASSIEASRGRTAVFSAAAEALARAHWPGALTLVLPAVPGADPALVGSDGTVAIRVPGSEFLRAVLDAAGAPLVTTSANAPGAPAPRALHECRLDGVALAVDGGTLSGLPSTIVQVEGNDVRVLRSGAVDVGGGVA